MKKPIKIMALACAIAILALTGAGCGSSAGSNSNAQNSQNTQNGQNAPNGQQGPGGFSGTMGIVTAVSDSSITIAVMPQNANSGGQPPQGSGQPNASGAPQGGQPSASFAPQGGQGPSATMDTSSWEKKTFTIDSSTKITQGQGANATSSTTLKASDITVGESVSVTERTGKTGTADQVSVMQGFSQGGPGGQGGPNGQNGCQAPANTSKA